MFKNPWFTATTIISLLLLIAVIVLQVMEMKLYVMFGEPPK